MDILAVIHGMEPTDKRKFLANQRERNRVRQMGEAFERLRRHVHIDEAEVKLSQFDIVCRAIDVIRHLKSILEESSDTSSAGNDFDLDLFGESSYSASDRSSLDEMTPNTAVTTAQENLFAPQGAPTLNLQTNGGGFPTSSTGYYQTNSASTFVNGHRLPASSCSLVSPTLTGATLQTERPVSLLGEGLIHQEGLCQRPSQGAEACRQRTISNSATTPLHWEETGVSTNSQYTSTLFCQPAGPTSCSHHGMPDHRVSPPSYPLAGGNAPIPDAKVTNCQMPSTKESASIEETLYDLLYGSDRPDRPAASQNRVANSWMPDSSLAQYSVASTEIRSSTSAASLLASAGQKSEICHFQSNGLDQDPSAKVDRPQSVVSQSSLTASDSDGVCTSTSLENDFHLPHCRRTVSSDRILINRRLREKSRQNKSAMASLRESIPINPLEGHLTTSQVLMRAAYYINFLSEQC